MFSATTYKERRQKLIQSMDSGLLLLLGNNDSPMNYTDNIYPYRQDSNFLYFAGIDIPQFAVIIDIDSGTTTLYGNNVSVEMVVWTGPQASVRELADKAGIESIASLAQLTDDLAKAKSANRNIHFLPPYRFENKIRLSQMLGLDLRTIDDQVSLAFVQSVIKLRAKKSEEEIVELDRACSITTDMHVAAMKVCRPGIKESEVVAAVRYEALKHGGDVSYPVIGTIHGETLHNHHYHHTLEEGQLFLLDAGAETDTRYAGDMTRTFPVSPSFTSQQKEIYQIVLDAENRAIEMLKPGITYKEVHLEAARTITKGMQSLGLMKGDVESSIAAGAHALFFPHGLGHMMGLDVHDMEDLGEDHVGYTDQLKRSTQFGLKSLRLGRKLEEGFVLTVEPGIYFIPLLIDTWKREGTCKAYINFDKLDAYRSFGGIRIEEDYLITAGGSRLLGKALAKSIEDVETIRNS
ncbi:MAG: aminopeptidase P family protein [Bacteroidota bacterium]